MPKFPPLAIAVFFMGSMVCTASMAAESKNKWTHTLSLHFKKTNKNKWTHTLSLHFIPLSTPYL